MLLLYGNFGATRDGTDVATKGCRSTAGKVLQGVANPRPSINIKMHVMCFRLFSREDSSVCQCRRVVRDADTFCQSVILMTQSLRVLLCSNADYMLALALQQEDASALASASPAQPGPVGDEAVAMALLTEDRALQEQRIGDGNHDTTLVAGSQGVPFREDRDRFVRTPTSMCFPRVGRPT